jgi:hypothetical protein
LTSLLDKYSGPAGFDAETQQQLVTDTTWAVHGRVEELIEAGAVNGTS